jgi:hypothetical protein
MLGEELSNSRFKAMVTTGNPEKGLRITAKLDSLID